MSRSCKALVASAIVLAAAPAAAQWQAPAQPAYAPPAPVSIPGMPQVILPPIPVPGAAETAQRLDQAKASDSGRKLEWVWIDAHGGFEQIGLQTFSGDKSFTNNGAIKTSSSGAVAGVGIGARLLFLTLLARGRIGFGSIGHFYRIGPEIGLHIPFGRIEPHVEIGGGYGAFGKVFDNGAGIAIQSAYARAGLGLDVFVVPVLSLGVGVTTELLALFRSSMNGGSSATSIGGSLAATAALGLHF